MNIQHNDPAIIYGTMGQETVRKMSEGLQSHGLKVVFNSSTRTFVILGSSNLSVGDLFTCIFGDFGYKKYDVWKPEILNRTDDLGNRFVRLVNIGLNSEFMEDDADDDLYATDDPSGQETVTSKELESDDLNVDVDELAPDDLLSTDDPSIFYGTTGQETIKRMSEELQSHGLNIVFKTSMEAFVIYDSSHLSKSEISTRIFGIFDEKKYDVLTPVILDAIDGHGNRLVKLVPTNSKSGFAESEDDDNLKWENKIDYGFAPDELDIGNGFAPDELDDDLYVTDDPSMIYETSNDI